MIANKKRRKKGARARRYASFRYQVDKISQEDKKHLGPQPVGHTLNHIIPIRKAFDMGLTAEETGSATNLEWTHHQKNIAQGSRMTPDSIRVLRDLGRDELADSWEYRLSMTQ